MRRDNKNTIPSPPDTSKRASPLLKLLNNKKEKQLTRRNYEK